MRRYLSWLLVLALALPAYAVQGGCADHGGPGAVAMAHGGTPMPCHHCDDGGCACQAGLQCAHAPAFAADRALPWPLLPGGEPLPVALLTPYSFFPLPDTRPPIVSG